MKARTLNRANVDKYENKAKAFLAIEPLRNTVAIFRSERLWQLAP
jgi:hypothetical protein